MRLPILSTAASRLGRVAGQRSLATALALAACTTAGEEDAATARSAAEQRKPVPTWQIGIAPVLSIGGAEAEGAAVLHGARYATRLDDGRIVIADQTSREIRFFGADGGHLRTVGGQGGGPGEFNFLTWLGRMRGDTILAHDEATRRMALFTAEAEYVRTVTLHLPGTPSFPSVVGAFDDGRVLARPSFDRQFGRGERRDTVPFFIYSRDGQRADTIGWFAGEEMYFVTAPEMSSRQPVGFGRDVYAAVAGDRAVIGTSDEYAVSLFRSSGALERRLQGDRSSEPVPAAAERDWRSRLGVGIPSQFRARIEPLLSQVPARQTYPAFGGLKADRAGLYWVMDYPRDPAGPRRWFVYRPDGTAVATLVTPARFEILEIGPDWLLGRSLDDDGVESVEMRALYRR